MVWPFKWNFFGSNIACYHCFPIFYKMKFRNFLEFWYLAEDRTEDKQHYREVPVDKQCGSRFLYGSFLSVHIDKYLHLQSWIQFINKNKKNNDLNSVYITRISWRFAYTYGNEIQRLLIKALRTDAIGPLLISSPPPHPTPPVNEYTTLRVSAGRILFRPQWFFYIPIRDRTTISMWSSKWHEGLTISRYHSNLKAEPLSSVIRRTRAFPII